MQTGLVYTPITQPINRLNHPIIFFWSDDLCSQGDIFPDLVKSCQLYLKDKNISVGEYFSAASSGCFMYCNYLGGTRGEMHGDIDLKSRLDYI